MKFGSKNVEIDGFTAHKMTSHKFDLTVMADNEHKLYFVTISTLYRVFQTRLKKTFSYTERK